MEIQKENRQPLKWCEYCGEAMHQDSNFCPHCSQKSTKVCNCWVLSKPYDCGQDECPGHGLWKILKSQKREDQAHSGCVEDNSKNGQAYRQGICIDIDYTSLNEAIGKTNRLVELLREAEQAKKPHADL